MVLQADLTPLVFLKPIFVFLIVFIVTTALLFKTKILGESFFWPLAVSFIMASIFAVSFGTRELLGNAIAWFAVLFIAVFFIVMLTAFIGKQGDIVGKGLGWFFVFVILAIFVFSGIKVYASTLGAYVPGPFYGHDADPQILYFFDWLWSPGVSGTFVFILVSAIVMFVLIKYGSGGGKK